MNLDTWYIYVGTVFILMVTPGPSQLLVISNSIDCGFRRSILTAIGDVTANLIQMIVATFGLVYLIENNENLIILIKWSGVIYLLYLGVTALLKQQRLRIDASASHRSNKSLFLQGFLVSAVNPKAVVFFAALFPQFIAISQPIKIQFISLSATYIVMDLLFLIAYAKMASIFVIKLSGKSNMFIRLAPGILLIAVALGLALKSI